MKFAPRTSERWITLGLLPLEVYGATAFLALWIARMLRPRHFGATNVEVYVWAGIVVCALILLLASLILAFTGPRRVARHSAGFGVVFLTLAWCMAGVLAH